MTTTQDARREDSGGIITITFTRDAKLNAVTLPMLELLEQAGHDLANDDRHRVLLITAEGRYFTAGVDISTMDPDMGVGTDGVFRGSNMRRQYRRRALHDFFDFLETVEKPVVLAAQGSCLGVGIELAASCDFRLAAEGVKFGLPEISNLGVLPGSGGISRLTRIVGAPWAKWLAMACESVDARQALAMGLVQAVYPAAEFPARARAFCERLASFPREAVGLAKLAVDAAEHGDRRTARDVDRLAQTLLLTGPEYRQKIDAFLSRSPSPGSGAKKA
ncbi:MAG: enoyl-CoA hydratase/isomerase family protein [Myxococcota bacterium]